MTTEKPQLQTVTTTETFYDYNEIVDYVEEKLGYPLRDTLGSHGHFYKWCDLMGYGDIDPEGNHRSSSQVWYADYKAHPEGDAKRPEYRDFWHWFADQYEISNGEVISLDLGYNLKNLDADKEWVREILACMIAEFGEEFDVLIEW